MAKTPKTTDHVNNYLPAEHYGPHAGGIKETPHPVTDEIGPKLGDVQGLSDGGFNGSAAPTPGA